MKSKDIQVCVLGQTDLDWTTCYLASWHVHKMAALGKVCRLLKKYPESRIDVFDFSVSSLPILRVGKKSAFNGKRRAWVYEGYWPTHTLSKLRKFYSAIEGADYE